MANTAGNRLSQSLRGRPCRLAQTPSSGLFGVRVSESPREMQNLWLFAQRTWWPRETRVRAGGGDRFCFWIQTSGIAVKPRCRYSNVNPAAAAAKSDVNTLESCSLVVNPCHHSGGLPSAAWFPSSGVSGRRCPAFTVVPFLRLDHQWK
jgi:hypothetical protein